MFVLTVTKAVADRAASRVLAGAIFIGDADQDPFGFLVSQTAHIETETNEVRYPDIQYPMLVPVDTSASEWSRSITYFSMDKVGQAGWFNAAASDVPHAETFRSKHDVTIEMGAIGYRYNDEELGQAMMTQQNLTADRAMAARRAAEEYIDNIVLNGDAGKGFKGLLNNSNVTATNAAQGAGTGTPREWTGKTPGEIISDVNNILGNLWSASKTVEMADTLLLPPAAYFQIAGQPRATGSDMTVLQWIQRANIYTATTGQELMIRIVRGLENAASSNAGRMIAYRRSPDVLKLHLPMPHKFLPVWRTGPLVYDVPGIFRIGGLEIRRPGAVRYMDQITT